MVSSYLFFISGARYLFSSGLAGDGGVMDGLRTELSAIVERSRIGDRKQQELEQIITRLEDELARHSTQTVQLEERLADKMAQIASLESKLGQRNLKVVDLQNELEEKISENGILQREVWNIVEEYRIITPLKRCDLISHYPCAFYGYRSRLALFEIVFAL